MTPDPRTARDAGLRRVRLVTGWLAAGALALTGAIVGWEVQSANSSGASTPAAKRSPAATDGGDSSSGNSSSNGSSSSSSPGGSNPGYVSPTDPGSSNGDQLQAPDYAPAPSSQGPAASSGGS
jgi:hypothetical protein